VPYKGAGPALADLLSGQVQMMITTPPSVVSQIRAGSVRALAIASKTRHPMLPDVPTTAEAGIEGIELDAWFALFAPAGTPPAAIKRLVGEVEKVVKSPRFKERAEESGTYATFMGPEQLDAFTRSELVRWSGLIHQLNIKIE
jgi:tripartite-type tricarboxylate transporter receptor subunit TctC